jgi:hypothetical protein
MTSKRVKRAMVGLAAGLLTGRAKHRKPLSSRELYEKSFRISTRRMGIVFIENIRDVFRLRWLRTTR